MQKISQIIKKRREGRDLMRQLRQAWQINSERIAQAPPLTDEELGELYRRASSMPPLPQAVLPPQLLRYCHGQRRTAWNNASSTMTWAAVAAILIFIFMPLPKNYANTLKSVGVEKVNEVNFMLKNVGR